MNCIAALGIAAMPVDAQQSVTETMTVTGTRLHEVPFDQPYAFYRLSADDLEGRIGRTIFDQMNYGPGVFMQRTAPNQASPFIRGLTGEQTLLMIDGVRLSHAFMRPGPNQYSALVPQLSLNSVDVILGSSSTVNGSDGLTGGLDFRLAPAGRGVEHGQALWAKTRLDSANGTTVQSGIDGAAGDWAYSFELGGSFFHDQVGGSDAGSHVFGADIDNDEIPNTGYDEYSGGLRLAYTGLADHTVQLSAGHQRQEDARRPDGYSANTGRADRIYRYFDPHTFTYLHLKDAWQVDGQFLDRLDTTVWWHQFGEDQLRSSVRDMGTASELIRRRAYTDTIDTRGIDLQATTRFGAQHKLTWGGTYVDERTNNRYREFRTPPGSTDLSLLAPFNPENWSNNTSVSDNSAYKSMGLFVQDQWQATDRFGVLLGLRYSAYEWSFGDVHGDTDDFTGSIRALWRATANQRLFVGVSRGFRAPNLTNLDGLADRGSSGNPATGNPNLQAEVSISYEAGWKWRNEGSALQLTAFRTVIDDFIQPDFSTAPAVVSNVEDAQLHGFESTWEYGIIRGRHHQLAFVGSLSWLKATRDIPVAGGGAFEDNLSRANRLYGHAGLEYKQGSRWSGSLQVRWHDAYDDVASHPSDADADDVRLTVAGSADGSLPGYAVADLMVGWQSDTGKRSIRFFIENLLNKTYREAGSGVDGVGRNFGVTAKIGF